MKIDRVASIDIAKLAAGYDDKRRMDPTEFERLLEWISHYGKVTGQVLEVGCGTGFYLVPLAQRLPGAHYCGIDIADAMLTQASCQGKGQRPWQLPPGKGRCPLPPFQRGEL